MPHQIKIRISPSWKKSFPLPMHGMERRKRVECIPLRNPKLIFSDSCFAMVCVSHGNINESKRRGSSLEGARWDRSKEQPCIHYAPRYVNQIWRSQSRLMWRRFLSHVHSARVGTARKRSNFELVMVIARWLLRNEREREGLDRPWHRVMILLPPSIAFSKIRDCH